MFHIDVIFHIDTVVLSCFGQDDHIISCHSAHNLSSTRLLDKLLMLMFVEFMYENCGILNRVY